jgi:heterodisulfide reductase subunit A2
MEARIGVLICDCGKGMQNIDFGALARQAADLPGVTSVNLSSDLCLDEGTKKMASLIKDGSLDRVVIAACSPDMKEHIFRDVLEKAGLNGNLLSMANIREQCSWAHDGDVTGKAAQLVRMATNRARLLQPVEQRELPVDSQVLVIGGGFSAINTALRLSSVGLRATLLERQAVMGLGSGELESLHVLDAQSLIDAAERDGNIDIITSAQITAVEGALGDFAVTMRRNGTKMSRKYGAVVLATGFRTEIAPKCDMPVHGQLTSGAGVVSQKQLLRMLNDSVLEARPAIVCFVVDCADENSRFSTLTALNNALAVKSRWGSEVYIVCKDVKVDAEGAERLYRAARECGVVFMKYDSSPKIAVANGRATVETRDVFMGEDTTIACDLLVAEELPLPAEGAQVMGSLLDVRLDYSGFFQDENVHLYPVDSERRGVFFVGECRGNSDIARVLTDVSSVAASICGLLCRESIKADVERVKVDPQKCVACLTCIRVCPHSAIQLMRVDSGKDAAVISDLACDACGVCAAICPAKAIEFQGYRDDEILAQIEAVG